MAEKNWKIIFEDLEGNAYHVDEYDVYSCARREFDKIKTDDAVTLPIATGRAWLDRSDGLTMDVTYITSNDQ